MDFHDLDQQFIVGKLEVLPLVHGRRYLCRFTSPDSLGTFVAFSYRLCADLPQVRALVASSASTDVVTDFVERTYTFAAPAPFSFVFDGTFDTLRKLSFSPLLHSYQAFEMLDPLTQQVHALSPVPPLPLGVTRGLSSPRSLLPDVTAVAPSLLCCYPVHSRIVGFGVGDEGLGFASRHGLQLYTGRELVAYRSGNASQASRETLDCLV